MWLYRTARSRASARGAAVLVVVAAAAAAPVVIHDARRVRGEMRNAFNENAYYAALPDAIARAGGRATVLRCGTVYTTPFDTQAVARALRARPGQVGIHARPPGTILARRAYALASDRRFRPMASTSRWAVATSCRFG